MSFTPGPWRVETADGRLPPIREIKMQHGEASTYRATIRAQSREHVCHLDFGYGKPYDAANAHLIAAAPALYEALKLWDTGCRVMDGPKPGCECYGCQTRAAIQLAEGRS